MRAQQIYSAASLASRAACLCAVLLAPLDARAQLKPRFFRAEGGPPKDIPCADLPRGAVITIPPELTPFMQFRCQNQVGQTLVPPDGVLWSDNAGHGMGLVASKPLRSAGGTTFPFSWYTGFAPLPLTAAQEASFVAGVNAHLHPHLPAGARIRAISATTSNQDAKRIMLVLPPEAEAAKQHWSLVFECNGECFSEDPEPMVLIGKPAHQR